MRGFRRIVLLAALSTLGSAGAEVRLKGKVTDENNAPVAGARVSLLPAPPTALPSQQAFSDLRGEFVMSMPQAGAYRVDVEREDYFSMRGQPVALNEGENELLLILSPVREEHESVEVTAAPTTVDMNTTALRRRVSGTAILNVPYPVTNDLRSAFRVIPGVTRDSRGGVHIHGASENQANYTLNGFSVTDPLTGRFESRISVESVQSLEVSSGRLAAEHGKGSAGVLAIYTRSGDDKFRYSATNFVPGLEYRKGVYIGSWTPRCNFSGPIRRGRAWFSDSFEIQHVKTVVEELPKGDDRTTSWRYSNFLHTQVNLTPANILHAGWLFGNWNAPRTGLSLTTPWEATVDRRSRQWFFHVKDQVYLPNRAILEIGYSANRTYGREIPQGRELFVILPDANRGNHFVDATRKASRDQVIANFFFPSFTAAGGHQLKAGADLNRLAYWQDVRRTGFEIVREDGARALRTVFEGNGLLRLANREVAVYLQDSWRLRPNVLLEVGVRADWDRILARWDPSPRAAVAWSPSGLENTKITLGYARTLDATNLGIYSRPQDQYSLTLHFSPDGTVGRGPAASVFHIGDRRLPRPRYENYTVGLEQVLPHNLSARLGYMARRGRNGFTYNNIAADEDAPFGKSPREYRAVVFDAFYDLTNGRRDVYDGFEVSVRQTFRREWEWLASYTHSRALSNAVVDIRVDDPVIVSDNVGPMPWDTPHRFLSWGYLPTPLRNWAVAYMLETRSGFPFSVQSDDGRIIGAVNDRRFPIFLELNLHFERRFRFRNNVWAFRFGANNINNRENPTAVINTITSSRFLYFHGGQGRSLNFRIRWLGKSS